VARLLLLGGQLAGHPLGGRSEANVAPGRVRG
jgi:hypothetical protein